MAHIAIMGAGLGGVPCAYAMRKCLGKTHRVTLIGASPYFEFTPSNPWVAVGWREREKTRVAMREPLAAQGIDWQEEPLEATPVPTGAPKTGYMIESMVAAIGANIATELQGGVGQAEATWKAICLAAFGDTGAAFVALPQIPPRNVTWTRVGKWVHLAKVAFEKYFLRKVRTGSVTSLDERYVRKALGIVSLRGTES